MNAGLDTRGDRGLRWCRLRLVVFWGAALGLVAGCGSLFGAGFVDLISPGSATINNSTGHVVLAFVNNAEVDERLVEYLTTTGGLTLTNAERRELRPRVRFRIRVTYSNGNVNSFEFVSGSRKLIDQRFDADAYPDLNQNDLDNTVVLCNVARVELDPSASIEVFVPVELITYQSREIQNQQGGAVLVYQVQGRSAPQFRPLVPDTVDADGNTLLRANIDVRDVPGPVVNPSCGAVVSVVMGGVLRVPFLENVDDDPSFDAADAATIAGIGGRYEFTVGVR